MTMEFQADANSPLRPTSYNIPPEPRNGYGLAALITAAVGAAAGLIPILFWIAGPAGIIGFGLALANRARIKRGVATNRKSTWWALGLSVVAVTLCIVGISIIVHSLDKVQHDLNQLPSFSPTS